MTDPLQTNSAGQYYCPTCRETFDTADAAIECDRWDRQQLSVSRYDREQVRLAMEMET